MLRYLLVGNINKKKDEIVNYISNYGNKIIDSVVCWSVVEYQQGLFLYRTNKNQYDNVLEAFIELWTRNLIDIEEWHYNFINGEQFANQIFESFFKVSYAKYKIRGISTEDAIDYIARSISDMVKNIVYSRTKYPINDYNYKYPCGVPGIYENGSIIKEDKISFTIEKTVLWANELKYEVSWAGYREIFLETEDEYIYFNE
jgi:hypothetical protein